MRGMFTVGVLDVFMENGVEFDGIVGTSAGAAFGCNYKSKQPGRAIRYNMKYCNDKRFCSVSSLIKTGNIFNAEFAYHTLPTQLDVFDSKTFSENETEFYVVATDVTNGEAVYHKCCKGEEEDLEWVRASASMPMVSKPVTIGGYTMLDGGMADSIPLKFFEKMGYSKNIVILTQPLGYVKKKNPLLPLARLSLRKYPAAYETFSLRHENYNDTVAYVREREERGEVLVIRPPHNLEIKKMEHDPAVLKAVYDIGRAEGEKELDRVRRFLNGDGK